MDKCMHVLHGVNVFIEFSVLVFTKTIKLHESVLTGILNMHVYTRALIIVK